jgi:hypothetical protein
MGRVGKFTGATPITHATRFIPGHVIVISVANLQYRIADHLQRIVQCHA